MIHYEIDVLGVVGRNPHLVLWSGLLHVVAVLERLSHLLGSGVLLVDDGCEVLDAAWAIVEYLVLVSGQCLDEVDQGLWVGGAHLVNAHLVELAVVLAILSQGAQGVEVGVRRLADERFELFVRDAGVQRVGRNPVAALHEDFHAVDTEREPAVSLVHPPAVQLDRPDAEPHGRMHDRTPLAGHEDVEAVQRLLPHAVRPPELR